MTDQMPPGQPGNLPGTPPDPYQTPAPEPGFGAPQPDGGFGAPQPDAGFGAPPVDSGFGAPPAGYPTDSGFGAPPADAGFAAPTADAGYGGAPAGFQQPSPYGAVPVYGGAYGAPMAVAVPVDSQGRPMAEWWQRAVAMLIDLIVTGIPSVVIAVIVLAVTTTTTTDVFGGSYSSTSVFGWLFGEYVLPFCILVLYLGVLDGGAKGQTLGKMAMGIATRDADSGGQIGVGKGVLRGFVYTVGWYFFFVPGLLNALWPLWDPKRQAISDKAANSVVVRVK
jgi:uncharacterized RDD family membrane protein YckC